MWVRTQDKKTLIEVIGFRIEKNYGGNKKNAVIGTINKGILFGSTTKLLGLYKNEEEAINELSNIENHISTKPS